MSVLFFLFGALTPFFAIGPQISNGLFLSPSIFIGIIIAAISIFTRGATIRLMLLVTMILVFALTSMGRHSLSSYVFSLTMLFSVMAPMCLSRIGPRHQRTLQQGFFWGLGITLFLVWIEIATQIAGQQAIYELVANLFRPAEERLLDHNWFIFYIRPYAAFLEPAHLSIYLAMTLLVLDAIGTRFAERLRTATILTLLPVGSLVGYVLLVWYLLAKLFFATRRGSKWVSKRAFQRVYIAIVLSGFAAFAVFALHPDLANAIIDKVFGRFGQAFRALLIGTLTGSEGSRVNTIRILFDYWQSEGLSGVLFGTGYGNSSDWLIQNYNHLEVWASAARGSVDSIIVGIFISTGLLGGVTYLLFAATCLKSVCKDSFPSIFPYFLLLNMATGFLIAYPIWHMLAIVLFLSPGRYVSASSITAFPSVDFRKGQRRSQS